MSEETIHHIWRRAETLGVLEILLIRGMIADSMRGEVQAFIDEQWEDLRKVVIIGHAAN